MQTMYKNGIIYDEFCTLRRFAVPLDLLITTEDNFGGARKKQFGFL